MNTFKLMTTLSLTALLVACGSSSNSYVGAPSKPILPEDQKPERPTIEVEKNAQNNFTLTSAEVASSTALKITLVNDGKEYPVEIYRGSGNFESTGSLYNVAFSKQGAYGIIGTDETNDILIPFSATDTTSAEVVDAKQDVNVEYVGSGMHRFNDNTLNSTFAFTVNFKENIIDGTINSAVAKTDDNKDKIEAVFGEKGLILNSVAIKESGFAGQVGFADAAGEFDATGKNAELTGQFGGASAQNIFGQYQGNGLIGAFGGSEKTGK